MRLIDADAIEGVLLNHSFCYCSGSDYSYGVADGFMYARDDVIEAPTIDAEPVRHGRWIRDRLVSTSGGTYGVRRCSLCEAYYQDVGYGWNYCPHCGAKMEQEDI